jgi:hypothetical protein
MEVLRLTHQSAKYIGAPTMKAKDAAISEEESV